MVRGFANGWETWVQSQVKSYQSLKKMILDAPLLNTQQCKVGIKGKVEQSRERNSILPYTNGVVAIEKEAFGSPQLRSPILLTYFFYFFGYFRLIETQNVCIHLNFLLTLSDGYSFVDCDPLLSWGCSYFFWDSQGLLFAPYNSFWCVQSHLLDILSMPPAVHLHKQMAISRIFVTLRRSSGWKILL